MSAYKSICDMILHMYMGSYTKVSVMEYMYTCEHSQGHKHICEFAQRGFIYKTIHDTMYVY